MPLTILHVEDSRLVAETVRDALEAEGWKVETCADGYAALNRFASATRYDLLLLDYGLPNVNGVELAKYARKLPRYRAAPIIMLSAESVRDEAKAAGVNLFLRKPEDMGLLVEAVRRLIG
ncbi:MAG: response regulator [Acidobacteriota bacterium]|nr:response regulator [Acidobacteriota bacterium]